MNQQFADAMAASITDMILYAGTYALPIDKDGNPNGPMDTTKDPPVPVQYPCFMLNRDMMAYRESMGETDLPEKKPHVFYFDSSAWGVINVESGFKVAGIWYKADAPMQEEFVGNTCVYFALPADEW